MILTSGLSYRPCWIIQNSQKMPFWMIQIAKNEFFGHFLELGASDRLQIAYSDYTKWSWHMGCHIAQAGSFKNHKMPFWMIENAKKRIFWSFSGVRFVGSTWYCILWHSSALPDQKKLCIKSIPSRYRSIIFDTFWVFH